MLPVCENAIFILLLFCMVLDGLLLEIIAVTELSCPWRINTFDLVEMHTLEPMCIKNIWSM